jgi:hypothetical protein
MARKIPLYDNNYVELTQSFPTTIITPGDESNNYQSTTNTDYNKTKPFFINRNDIIAVAELYIGTPENKFPDRRMVYLRNIITPFVVTQSAAYLRTLMLTINKDDLYEDGCNCI